MIETPASRPMQDWHAFTGAFYGDGTPAVLEWQMDPQGGFLINFTSQDNLDDQQKPISSATLAIGRTNFLKESADNDAKWLTDELGLHGVRLEGDNKTAFLVLLKQEAAQFKPQAGNRPAPGAVRPDTKFV